MSLYGFNLVKYSSFEQIPKKRAYRFLEQVRISVEERKLLRYLYDTREEAVRKHAPYFKAMGDIDYDLGHESSCPEWKDRNNDFGDTWVANIISQRMDMYQAEMKSQKVGASIRDLGERNENDTKQAEYARATRLSDARQKKQDVINSAHNNRVIQATAELRANLYIAKRSAKHLKEYNEM